MIHRLAFCLALVATAWAAGPAQAGSTSAFALAPQDHPVSPERRNDVDWMVLLNQRDAWDFFLRHAAEEAPPRAPPPPPACIRQTASPAAHIANERAVFGGLLGLRAVATGDGRDLGFAWDFYWARATLYQGEGGRWFTQPPPGCPP